MVCDRRRRRGYSNWRQGLDAEDRVADDYDRRGSRPLARRWRGPGGEIDLILQDGEVTVFVEVKKSRSFDEACARLGPRQIARIFKSAEAFLEGEPGGSLTNCRFDVALVDGAGRLQVIENAYLA